VILDYLDYQHVGNPLIPREGSARWRRLTWLLWQTGSWMPR